MTAVVGKNISTELAAGKGVAERWKEQYCKDGRWSRYINGASSEDAYSALVALGAEPSPAEVAKIIPAGWAYPMCDGCNEYRERVVLIEPHDDLAARLCEECLEYGLRELRTTK